MTDKAELVEQLEQRELTIGKLAGETETIGGPIQSYTHRCLVMITLIIVITLLHVHCGLVVSGEYIALYQSQREALRAKFKEKDSFIQRLISEKEAVQVRRV